MKTWFKWICPTHPKKFEMADRGQELFPDIDWKVIAKTAWNMTDGNKRITIFVPKLLY